MINKQCHNCARQGKNFYCNACDKTPEFFDIYSYYINRTSKNFFHDLTGDLNVDCEKEFAYIERKLSNQSTGNHSIEKEYSEVPIGYKIYLNKDKKPIEDAPK